MSVTAEEEESETDQILSIPVLATDISKLLASNANSYIYSGIPNTVKELVKNIQPQVFAKDIADQMKVLSRVFNNPGVLDTIREQQKLNKEIIKELNKKK